MGGGVDDVDAAGSIASDDEAARHECSTRFRHQKTVVVDAPAIDVRGARSAATGAAAATARSHSGGGADGGVCAVAGPLWPAGLAPRHR